MGMTLPRKGAKKSKYKNKIVYRDAKGNVCAKGAPGAWKAADSQAEYRRRCVLESLVRTGEIRNLKFQVRFFLSSAKGYRVSYVADFTYEGKSPELKSDLIPRWDLVVEDVKGMLTDAYKVKRAWMRLNGITILETRAK